METPKDMQELAQLVEEAAARRKVSFQQILEEFRKALEEDETDEDDDSHPCF